MAQKFLTNLNLNQNQLINATFQVLGSDPGVGEGNFEGRLIYNSTEDTIKVWSGSAWRKMLHNVQSGGAHTDAITLNESNGTITITLNLADADSAGLLTAAHFNDLTAATANATGGTLAKRDVDGKIHVATPTQATHAANKSYVDAARQGLDVKRSVRVATTASINLATDLEAGDVIDGVTLVAGDRVLVKNQVTASENGIYVAVASGAASRSSDANGTADTGELSGGTFTFVEEGTTNADHGFAISSNGPLTVGTDAIAWTQFSGTGSFTAGDGLVKDGNTINVVGTANRITVTADAVDIAATYVGQSSITTLGTITTGTWAATDVGIAHGGTNASSEADARTNLAAGGDAGTRSTSVPSLARVVTQTIGNNASSSFTITHNLNTRNLTIQVVEANSPYDTVFADVARTSVNTATVTFATAPATDAYTVVVTG